jgi:integrase
VTSQSGPASIVLSAGDQIAAAAQQISDPLVRADSLEQASANVVVLQQRIREERAKAIREAISVSSATAVADELNISRTRLYKILGPELGAQRSGEVDALLEPLLVRGAIADDLRRAIVLVTHAGLRLPETAALSWDDIDLPAADDEGAVGVARVRSRRGVVEVALNRFVMDHLLPEGQGFVLTGDHMPPDPLALANRVSEVTHGAGVKTIQVLRRAFEHRAPMG